MKSLTLGISIVLLGLASASANEQDTKKLIKQFHQYGIKNCDSVIARESRLTGNWTYSVSKHTGGLKGGVTEVSVVRIWGSEDDTVMSDESYIETASACHLHQRATLTFKGSCASNIDGDAWYLVDAMEGRDYRKYENAGGATMYAKEINMGNFKSCVMQHSIRNQFPKG